MKNVILSVFILLVGFAQAQNKKVDVAKSSIQWIGKKVTGEHSGTINFQEGMLIFKGKKVAGGNFTVDMTSINTTDLTGEWKAKLDGHLKADDFFGTDKFKTATLKFTKIADKGNGVYGVTADLTIKGITKPINFDLNVKGNSASANLVVDRSKYDIKYGSKSFFEGLGDKTIYDDFELKVNLVF